MKKQDFIEWRDHPVTQACHNAVAEVASELVAELVKNVEIPYEREHYLRGWVKGIQAVMEWDPEFEDD